MIKASNINPNAMTQNIMTIYSLATQNEIDQGMSWYNVTNKMAQELADGYGTELVRTAALLSVLSVGVTWERAVHDTILLLEDREYKPGTFGKQAKKAVKILDENCEYPANLYQYFGFKTFAFFKNIMKPYSKYENITIDRHASRVACGWWLKAEQATKYVNTKNKYDRVAFSYEAASSWVARDMVGSQLQAITWLTFKRLKGKEFLTQFVCLPVLY